jgi:ABC-2 type transport system permease protein
MTTHRLRSFRKAWSVAGRIIGISFRAQLEYRTDFALSVSVGAVWLVSVIVPTNALGDLVVGVSMFIIAVLTMSLDWTAARIGYLVAGLVGGTLMEAAVFVALSALHFHYPSSSYWSVWTEELLATFGSYPLAIFPRLISGAFTFVLPLAFIAYFPAAVLTGHDSGLGVPFAVAAGAPLTGLAAFVGARVLWNRSLRHYTGVNG